MINYKNKQIMSLTLATAIALGSVGGVAFADSVELINEGYESGYTGQNESEYEKEVIQSLVDRGYVVGYDDGSLGEENLITRAEFAAIATRVLGLEDLAETLKGTPTGFSDVNVSDWHNGYIGVTRTKNVVTGYPNQTFKPEGQITYGEALTILSRIFLTPEEDSLVRSNGKWPTNYFLKSAELGLLEGITGLNADEQAVRGKIFLALNNAVEIVEEKNTTKVETLVLDNDKDTLDLVILEASGSFKQGDVLNIPKTKETLEKVSIGSIYNVKVNADKKITALEESKKATTVNGKLTKDRKDFKVDGKTYNTDSLLKLKHNGKEVDFKDFPAESEFSTATIFDGKLIYVEAHSFDEIIPIEEVKNNRIYGITKDGNSIVVNFGRNTNISLLDGTEIKVEDIKAGDIAHIRKNRRDTEVVITQKSIKGKVEDVNVKNNSIVIDEKEYKIEENGFPTILAQGRRFIPIVNINRLAALKENNVELSINLNGKVQLIKTEKDISLNNKVIVESIEKDRLHVVTQDGHKDIIYVSKYTHLIDSRDDRYDRDERDDRYNVDRIMSQIKEGDMIKALIDARGDIEELEILKGKDGVISYIDSDIVEIDGREEYLVEDYALFSVSGGKYEVVNKEEFANIFYDNKDARVNALVFEDYREIEALVIEGKAKDFKVELVKAITEAKEIIGKTEQYKDNKKVQSTIDSLNKIITEIETSIDKMDEKAVEISRGKLSVAVSKLNKEVMTEVLAQIDTKVKEVEKTNKAYNEKALSEVKDFYSVANELEEVERNNIEEAEKTLADFDAKVYDDILEIDSELNALKEAIETELVNIETVLSRVVYNESVVNNYKSFLDGLNNAVTNISDLDTVKTLHADLKLKAVAFEEGKFDLSSTDRNLVKLFLLEERVQVANKVVELAGSSSNELIVLNGRIKSAVSFINSSKNKEADKIDMDKLQEADTQLRVALVGLSAKLNLGTVGTVEEVLLIAEADIAYNSLLTQGEMAKAFRLNDAIVELKAYIIAGAEDLSIEEIKSNINFLLDSVTEVEEDEEEVEEEQEEQEEVEEEEIETEEEQEDETEEEEDDEDEEEIQEDEGIEEDEEETDED